MTPMVATTPHIYPLYQYYTTPISYMPYPIPIQYPTLYLSTLLNLSLNLESASLKNLRLRKPQLQLPRPDLQHHFNSTLNRI
jgi:hypothetical protein